MGHYFDRFVGFVGVMVALTAFFFVVYLDYTNGFPFLTQVCSLIETGLEKIWDIIQGLF